jgi:hypothetical protein
VGEPGKNFDFLWRSEGKPHRTPSIFMYTIF